MNDATKHGAAPFNTLDGLHIVAKPGVKLVCPGTGPLSSRGSGIDLHASNVTIEFLDVDDCASGISVEANYGGELIAGNRLDDNVIGISINNGIPTGQTIFNQNGNNSVVFNQIFSNSGDGVFDFQAQGDYFTGNIVHDNGGNGIEISTTLTAAGGEYSAVITANDVEHNAANGVYLNHADDANIRDNILTENGNDGLYLNQSFNSGIAANDADENQNNGMEVNSASAANIFQDNRMKKNTNSDAADHDSSLWINNHCTTTGGSATCVP